MPCSLGTILEFGVTSVYLLPQNQDSPAQKIELIDDDEFQIHCLMDTAPEYVYTGGEVLMESGIYKNLGLRGIRYQFTLIDGGYLSEDLFNKLVTILNWNGRKYLRPRDDNKKVYRIDTFDVALDEISKVFYSGERLKPIKIKAMELESAFYDMDDSALPDYDDFIPDIVLLQGGAKDQAGTFVIGFNNFVVS